MREVGDEPGKAGDYGNHGCNTDQEQAYRYRYSHDSTSFTFPCFFLTSLPSAASALLFKWTHCPPMTRPSQIRIDRPTALHQQRRHGGDGAVPPTKGGAQGRLGDP